MAAFQDAGSESTPDQALDPEQSQALLEVVIEAMPNAVVLVGEKGMIRMANSRATRLFGYDPQELTGLDLNRLLPERYREQHAKFHSGFMRAPGTREMGAGRDLFGRRKDGTELPIEVGLDVLRTTRRTFVLASIFDATERREAQRIAADATALAQSIIDSAPFAILATNIDGVVLEISPAAEEIIGRLKADVIGRPCPIRIHDSNDSTLRRIELVDTEISTQPICGSELLGRIQAGKTDTREWSLQRPDGSTLPIDLALSGLRHSDGRLVGYIGIAHDISERKRAETAIRHIAEHDALTGLPNRSLLKDRIDVAIARARRTGTLVGILLIDLDHFKRVNDSLGHHVGDNLLVSVAQRLMQAVRGSDTVARMGGDEFVVVLSDLPSREQARETAESIVSRLSEPSVIEGHTVQISPSIGLCTFPEDGDDAELLIMNADTAMYAAKELGRRRYLAFTPEMAAEASERWTLERALRHAVENNILRVHYQPQVDVHTGRVFGVEALVRWPQEGRGFMSPNRFIPIAEQTGLIAQIGEWVLRTACAEIGALRPSLSSDLRLSVNLSPRQLRIDNLSDIVAASLADTDFSANLLELEITEGALLQDGVTPTINKLRASGIRIAIDDFGTGFSSLSHITRIPVDCLKIDCSFVRGVDSDVSQAAVTAAIIAIAKRLDIRVIAEGVENEQELQALKEQGCHHFQGFLYSAAVPASALVKTIRDIETSADIVPGPLP